MTTCDFCDAEFAMKDRHVVAMRRPSDPMELCAVMWACPTCGVERDLPTASTVEQQVEDGEIEGVFFVTV